MLKILYLSRFHTKIARKVFSLLFL